MDQEYSNTTSEAPVSRDSGIYPYNRVERTLSGHQFETDNTIGAERIKRLHTSGTYEEWDATGGSTKVIHGRDYTLIMDGKELIVHGAVNIVVVGDCNTSVTGNYNLTVGGDYNMHVAGTSRRRINGNDFTETTGDRAYNVGQSYKIIAEDDYICKIKGDNNVKIQGRNDVTIGSGSSVTCTGHSVDNVDGLRVLFSTDSASLASGGDLTLASSGSQNYSSASFNVVKGPVNITDAQTNSSTITAVGDVRGSGVSLEKHTHLGVTTGTNTSGIPVDPTPP